MKKSFEETVGAMSPKQIVMAMVKGLKKEHVRVDMGYFGSTFQEGENRVCYGCAATNTICEISGVVFTPENILGRTNRRLFLETTSHFLAVFETAIDCLRRGDVKGYNAYAEGNDMPLLPEPVEKLPKLETDDYLQGLPAYVKYANSLEPSFLTRLWTKVKSYFQN